MRRLRRYRASRRQDGPTSAGVRAAGAFGGGSGATLRKPFVPSAAEGETLSFHVQPSPSLPLSRGPDLRRKTLSATVVCSGRRVRPEELMPASSSIAGPTQSTTVLDAIVQRLA